MKHFRNPILSQLLLSFLLFSLTVRPQQAKAQFVVVDVVQNINTVIQTVSQAAIQVTTLLDQIQHSKFYEALKAVKNGIKQYNSVKRIIDYQLFITKSAVENLNRLKNSQHIHPQQLLGMAKMYKYFMEQSISNVKELTKMISPNIFEMSDAERLAIIDRLDNKVKELAHHLNYYNIQNVHLEAHQQLQASNMEKMLAYYAPQATVAEDETTATAKIGGFYGQIVNLLYGLSSIVGLIGAVKIYAKFSRGDEDVFTTTTSWLGATLLCVIITTFIKMVFF